MTCATLSARMPPDWAEFLVIRIRFASCTATTCTVVSGRANHSTLSNSPYLVELRAVRLSDEVGSDSLAANSLMLFCRHGCGPHADGTWQFVRRAPLERLCAKQERAARIALLCGRTAPVPHDQD